MTEVVDKPIRKAAVFLRGLAPEVAEAMLTRLTASEAAALRAAVAELDHVDPREESLVENEIRSRASKQAINRSQETSEGVELQLGSSAVEASLNVQPSLPEASAPLEQSNVQWFESLRYADPQTIATFLKAEQPRTAALVLSHLSPDLASAVLDAYPESEQGKLLALLSRQGDADPTSVGVVAKELAEWIRKQNDEKRRRADRLAAIRSIVAASTDDRRERLVRQLRQDEPDLAAELGLNAPTIEKSKKPFKNSVNTAPPRPPAMPYEKLEQLDAKVLARALGMLDGRTALLALAEASDALLARVESRLTRKATKELRRRLTQLGATTLIELDQAQLAFAYAAEQALANR